jgi:hypothetical protein
MRDVQREVDLYFNSGANASEVNVVKYWIEAEKVKLVQKMLTKAFQHFPHLSTYALDCILPLFNPYMSGRE